MSRRGLQSQTHSSAHHPPPSSPPRVSLTLLALPADAWPVPSAGLPVCTSTLLHVLSLFKPVYKKEKENTATGCDRYNLVSFDVVVVLFIDVINKTFHWVWFMRLEID